MQVITALNTLAKNAQNVRAGKGYTVAELAALKSCGISESTIRRIESANKTGYNPTLATLVKMSNGLRVPLQTLVAQFKAVKNV